MHRWPARCERSERLLEKSNYYDAAREFSRIVSTTCQIDGQCDYVIVTGGGPGIMEAANRGAFDVGAKSAGLNIHLPAEQAPNPYITPELCFQFHYFALRKMHFLLRAKALVAFPGGFGTLDEMFDALTLRQTRRMQDIPIILFGRAYWEQVIDFQFLADEGVITDAHLKLFCYADTPEEAWNQIRQLPRRPAGHRQRERVAAPSRLLRRVKVYTTLRTICSSTMIAPIPARIVLNCSPHVCPAICSQPIGSTDG